LKRISQVSSSWKPCSTFVPSLVLQQLVALTVRANPHPQQQVVAGFYGHPS